MSLAVQYLDKRLLSKVGFFTHLILLDVDTQARKLTIFGCLSPSNDFPSSISWAKDSFSGSLLLSVDIQTV